jgi:N utilization substance protein A
MSVTFDTETIQMITFFENLTGAPVKDCLINDGKSTIYFLIDEGKAGIAIGKNGSSIKRAENMINKKIKIFEYSKDLVTFVKNLIPQAENVKIKNEGDKAVVEINVSKKDKAMVIGRDRKNLKLFKELLQRSHQVSDLIVR